MTTTASSVERHLLARAALLIITGLMLANAGAQTARSGGGGGDARLQAMVNQLNGEKANLQRENDKLTKELNALKADLRKAESKAEANEDKLKSASASAARLQRNNESAQNAIERYKQREEELIAEFRKTINILRDTEAEKGQISGQLAETRLAYRECAKDNTEMFTVATDVLDAYENKGLFTRAAQGEPFTQLARVRIENLVDEYRYALEDSQIDVRVFEDEEITP